MAQLVKTDCPRPSPGQALIGIDDPRDTEARKRLFNHLHRMMRLDVKPTHECADVAAIDHTSLNFVDLSIINEDGKFTR